MDIASIRGVGTVAGGQPALQFQLAARGVKTSNELTADMGSRALLLIRAAVVMSPTSEEHRLDVQA